MANMVRGAVVGVVGSLAAAVGIPAVEMLVAKRARHAAVPGPHALDGIICAGPSRSTASVIWLGDSLSSGVGVATPEESFPRQVAALAARTSGRGVTLTCLATPGARVADVLEVQVPAACRLAGPGSTVVVAVGANDVSGLTPLRRFRARYLAVIAALGATGATVVCVGLPDMSSAALLPQPLRAIAGWLARRVDGVVRQLASSSGAGYVAIGCGPPSPARTGFRSREAALLFLSADQWHPNGAGYGIWARMVSDYLRGVWAPRPSPASWA